MNETTRKVKKVPNPTGKGGFGDYPEHINPGGEPKNSMKNYMAAKLAQMTPEQKDKWLKDNKISGIDKWKMAEGNPSNEIEHSGRLTIEEVLDQIENEDSPTQKQGMENK